MTTVPGTRFTEEQLETARKVDNVSGGDRVGSDRMKQIGFVYKNEKKQYDKALAWYILAARGNNSVAQNNIGILYYNGYSVPKNYLCALKWFLKAAEQNEYENTPNNIGLSLENGRGVPLNKYKALEWYCHGGDKSRRDRLKREGYHRSASNKTKTLKQLRKETEAILDGEKKKLEDKQDKTQQEMEALVDLNITYKLVGGGQNAWKDVPILFADDRQRYTQLVNSSVANKGQKILELKKQIQLLNQDKNYFESQANQLQQERTNIELQIKQKDKELVSLRNDKQSLQRGNSTVQHQTKDSKMNSLQVENQELKLKIILLQTENQSLKHKVDEYEQQTKSKDNTINLLESDGEDINYDTPSEDEDNNNDLNYDDVNESNK